MYRKQNSNHFGRHSQKCCWQQQKSKQTNKTRNRLTQGTGQIKFLAAVVNRVLVPEKIDLVRPAMSPIAIKIDYEKCDYISQDRCFNMKNGQMIYHPFISDDADA